MHSTWHYVKLRVAQPIVASVPAAELNAAATSTAGLTWAYTVCASDHPMLRAGAVTLIQSFHLPQPMRRQVLRAVRLLHSDAEIANVLATPFGCYSRDVLQLEHAHILPIFILADVIAQSVIAVARVASRVRVSGVV